ncbi:MAG: hypothetical protein AUJ52_14645 [Elusimicrobia bacterium CG1_02_63_36]|nr:MAG: hypothetical protein AUJ52_14645 [Elusimicrobia bacterium CG1_02_63_36]PIP82161.1 MAG: Fe-S oxidoreductase [Elusimicrobia bacterium CG22_combo_CG10-13_8_21_14_all_63_91]PJA18178.1 MAG: Fe-S oxidoreductase [Elusimicrobia bacterium CG_4_10_14_0_2_um_filter_63_34]PJB23548.1 MAG: Fe-S oxidoreductase [Elusimicrobia bacterium CG_4_9_14_3_um_filter_62_55]
MEGGVVVSGIWRYPVKSMRGESLRSATVGISGILGDRGWAVYDVEAREIRGAKKLPALMLCAARYAQEPSGGRIPPAEIVFPDGTRLLSDDPKAAVRLCELLGRRVILSSIRPKEDLAYYRRAPVSPEALEGELRASFGLQPDEPVLDLASFGEEFLRFAAPPGTHFDASSLHLLSTAALRVMAEAAPESDWAPERFRPNLLLESSGTTPPEPEWCGRRIAAGSATLEIEEPTLRCVMTTLEQSGLPKDLRIMRTLAARASRCLGVYAAVESGGIVSIGDKIRIF